MSRERVRIVLYLFNSTKEFEELEHTSFLRALRLAPSQVTMVSVHHQAPSPSQLEGAHAVVIGGSRLSVWEDVPHATELAETVKAARAKKIPIMGVCFGAQFLAHIFGGKVVRDVSREERGTFELTTSDDSFTDMLFADAPFTFLAQLAHQDCITMPPIGAVVLASSKACPVQAFSVPGADIYGVQFHPERSKEDYERSNALMVAEGSRTPEAAAAINATLKETPQAESLLGRFIDRIVLNAR